MPNRRGGDRNISRIWKANTLADLRSGLGQQAAGLRSVLINATTACASRTGAVRDLCPSSGAGGIASALAAAGEFYQKLLRLLFAVSHHILYEGRIAIQLGFDIQFEQHL